MAILPLLSALLASVLLAVGFYLASVITTGAPHLTSVNRSTSSGFGVHEGRRLPRLAACGENSSVRTERF